MDEFRIAFTLVANARPQRCLTMLTEHIMCAVDHNVEKDLNEPICHRNIAFGEGSLNVTVNWECYIIIITDFFVLESDEVDMDDFCF